METLKDKRIATSLCEGCLSFVYEEKDVKEFVEWVLNSFHKKGYEFLIDDTKVFYGKEVLNKLMDFKEEIKQKSGFYEDEK